MSFPEKSNIRQRPTEEEKKSNAASYQSTSLTGQTQQPVLRNL